MVTFLAISVSLVAFSLALMQIVYAGLFQRFLLGSSCDDSQLKMESCDLPPAAVVLCLRGADPSLRQVLSGLANQSYPDFEVHIMVDSLKDEAVQYVKSQSLDHLKFQIHEFPNKLSTCSLKCSALICAVESISSSIEFLAFLDADTVPDSNWLRDLIVPLFSEGIGATTGNRWYWPACWTPGTAVRQVWNSAAIVQLTLYGIAWGGSFAIKRSTLANTDILKRWGQSFCEDTLLSVELKKKSLKLLRVPGLICVNDESIGLASASNWIARQLFTVRLYHPFWPLIVLHGLLTFISAIGPPFLIIACFFAGATTELLIILSAFGTYQISNLILLSWIDARVFELASKRMPIPSSLSGWDCINRFSAIFLNQLIYPWAVWNAMIIRHVRWRGIEYSFDRCKQLRMREYLPYKSESFDAMDSNQSRRSID